jgi:alpha-1,3-glucosyltransferase
MVLTILYSLIATNSKANLRVLVILSAAGIYSLYPLLFHPSGTTIEHFDSLTYIYYVLETPIKITITLLWFATVVPALAYYVKT